MKKLISTIVILSLALPLLLAQRNKETITKNIFKNTPILFNPTEYPNSDVEKRKYAQIWEACSIMDNYIEKNQDTKKDKSKLLFYNQVLKSRLVLIEFLREIMYDDS